MDTIKIKSTDPKTQGPFVLINAADFDPAKHQKYDEAQPVETKRKKEQK